MTQLDTNTVAFAAGHALQSSASGQPASVRTLDAMLLTPVDAPAKLRRARVLGLLTTAYHTWDNETRVRALRDVAALHGIGFEEFFQALRIGDAAAG